MAFHKIALIQGLTSKMRWNSKRQEVLTGNMARADLPGAQAKDLEPFRLPRSSKKSSPILAKTNRRHMASPSQGSGGHKVQTDKTETDVTLAGNHINPESQLRKMNETATDHAKTASLYKNATKIYKTFLRG